MLLIRIFFVISLERTIPNGIKQTFLVGFQCVHYNPGSLYLLLKYQFSVYLCVNDIFFKFCYLLAVVVKTDLICYFKIRTDI